MKNFYLFLLITVLSVPAFAQNCTIVLNRAEDDYEAGRLLGIPERITPCLEAESFSREEEIRALKLMTLVYIFTDNDTKADEYLVRLLKADPEHDLDPEVDPAELYYLYNQFRVKPIFRIAFRAGINTSAPQIVNSFSTSDTNTWPKFTNGKTPTGLKEYKVGDNPAVAAVNGIGLGTFLELMIERHLKYGIEVAGGPQLRISTFNVDQYINNASIFNTIKEQQTYLRVPALVRYNLWYDDEPKRSILPYAYAGGSFDYLLVGQVSEGSRTGGTSYSLVENNDYKANEMVDNTNISVFGGLGAKFRIATHFLTLEMRYDRSFGLYNNPGNRWNNNQNSTFDVGYVQDDLKLNFFSFSVGYTQSIYSPKKLVE
ncbi:MAG: hypothetical protein ACFHWX_11465 [Bacteroidota bacterium]